MEVRNSSLLSLLVVVVVFAVVTVMLFFVAVVAVFVVEGSKYCLHRGRIIERVSLLKTVLF